MVCVMIWELCCKPKNDGCLKVIELGLWTVYWMICIVQSTIILLETVTDKQAKLFLLVSLAGILL